MKRVLIIGSGGAGKTTVAKALAARTGLPLIHLDQLFWSPGWVPTPDHDWDALIQRLIGQDQWIMDGNYGRTLPTRLTAADTIIFLDLPRLVCVWRILARRWRYFGRSRPDVAPGCPEHLTLEFLGWVWTYPSRRRPDILRRLESVRSEKEVVILQSAREVERFLATIP